MLFRFLGPFGKGAFIYDLYTPCPKSRQAEEQQGLVLWGKGKPVPPYIPIYCPERDWRNRACFHRQWALLHRRYALLLIEVFAIILPFLSLYRRLAHEYLSSVNGFLFFGFFILLFDSTGTRLPSLSLKEMIKLSSTIKLDMRYWLKQSSQSGWTCLLVQVMIPLRVITLIFFIWTQIVR